MNPLIWDGQRLAAAEGFIAFDTETEALPDLAASCPRLALASASDGEKTVVILPGQLARFVGLHATLDWVCHNASFDFWVVHDFLPRPSAALDSWWLLADTGRLHCTLLLDKLVRLALGEGESAWGGTVLFRRNLEKLAQAYGVGAPDKANPYRLRFGELLAAPDWSAVDPGFFDYAAKDALVTYRLYAKLRDEAGALARKHLPRPGARLFDVYPDAPSRYGLLSETIQVQGDIGLLKVTRNGLHADPARVAALEARYRQAYRDEADWLDAHCPGFFHHYGRLSDGKGGGVVRDRSSGKPRSDQKVLKRVLQEVAADLGVAAPVSTGKGAWISRSTKDWKRHARDHEFLSHWSEFVRCEKLLAFFAPFRDKGHDLHPRYDPLVRTGRTACSGPNVQQWPKTKEFRSLFTALPGHVLMTCDYSYVELRAVAAVCRHRLGKSALADVIKAGRDPHDHTAAMLMGLSQEDYARLKAADPDLCDRRRQQAKVPNFGLIGGMHDKKFLLFARDAGLELTPGQASDLRKRWLSEVYPEFNESTGYMAAGTSKNLARNLGLPHADVLRLLTRHGLGPVDCAVLEKAARWHTARKGPLPYQVDYLTRLTGGLDAVVKLARPDNPARRSYEQNGFNHPDTARLLFCHTACTLTGRVRHGVGYTEGRNCPFQGLAADGAKLAVYRLVRGGYRVRAMVHDEFLVELPADTARADAVLVEGVMNTAMGEVLGGVVPSAVKWRLGDCWRK